MIMDTGSDLMWVQCVAGQPSSADDQQDTTTTFLLALSSTYATLPCSHAACQSLPGQCMLDSSCRYTYSYASQAITEGQLASDSLTLLSTIEGAIDAPNILKPALAQGELQCIGATTLDEYRKHIEKDPALERRFQPVQVPEPTVDEAIQILQGLREHYEIHHKLHYTDESLVVAAEFSYQYTSDRFLPDKAIDLIDETGSRVRLRHAQLPDEAKEVDKELRHITKEKNESVGFWIWSCEHVARARRKIRGDEKKADLRVAPAAQDADLMGLLWLKNADLRAAPAPENADLMGLI
ncbi:hypothetical protein L7F22_007935 [Adiantum nelumboides]|nr:hypothetical protein [Adiantum nelumboides]